MADQTRYLRAALALHGITAGTFAQSLTPPVGEGMVYGVAAGRKSSTRVAEAIAKLIADAGLTMPETADDADGEAVADVADGEMIESGGAAPPVGATPADEPTPAPAAPAPAAVTGAYAHYRVVRFDRTSGRDVEVMADSLTHRAARDLAGQHRAADIEREHVVGYRVASGDLKAQAAGVVFEPKVDADEQADPVEQARRFVARVAA